MVKVKSVTCNAFQENSYVLYDGTGECVIIDPGVSSDYEETMLCRMISEDELSPVLLLNTHCHIDHILGNKFVANKFKLTLGIHQGEQIILDAAAERAVAWGIPYTPSPKPGYYIKENQVLTFGTSQLEVRFVPGHAPGHIVFVNHANRFVIAGDTLFKGSIGRTDLPFGNFDVLEKAIKSQLYSLPDDYVVYPGHGVPTTIGLEKKTNPFVRP